MNALETNKQLARDYFAAFLARDGDWWARFIDASFVRHDPGLPFTVRGPAGMHQLADILHGGIPDMALPIDDIVAEADRVLVRLRVLGTHGGDLMGVAATGHPIAIDVMDCFRLAEGRFVEHWALIDQLTLARQIGAVTL